MNIREKIGILFRARPAAPRPAEATDQTPGDHAETRANFAAGLKAYAAQEYTSAIECFERVINTAHDDADAHNNLGLSCLALHRWDDAADAFVLATHFRPGFAQGFYNLALAELGARRIEGARSGFQRAIELDPDYAAAHNALGHVLIHHVGDFDTGAHHIRRALELCPDDPDALCNYSAVLAQTGRSREAIEICDQLIESDPAMHEARLNRGLARLRCGDFRAGWSDYEARKLAAGNYHARTLSLPEWQGEPLQSKRLLVYAEQGLGDQIMFASCIPDLARRGAECRIECAPQLTALFARSFAPARVIAESNDDDLMQLAQSEGTDYKVALGSLPFHFRTSRDDFGAGTAYLRADSQRVRFWKERLAQLGEGLKVGISWAGGAASTRGASRSTRLSEWAPVFANSRCHFVSLQYGDAATELDRASFRLLRWPEALAQYDETAALVSALDLIISVQTALVHLAGAVGTTAWVMLQATAEWRYGDIGEAMPWYSSVRLIRQSQPNDWQPVIERVARDLAAHPAR